MVPEGAGVGVGAAVGNELAAGVGEGSTAGAGVDGSISVIEVGVAVGVGCAVLCMEILCLPCRVGTGETCVCPQGRITEASQIRPSAREPNMKRAITMGNTLCMKPP